MSKKSLSYYTEVEKFYFSPLVTLGQGIHTDDYLNLYVFLGKSTNFNSDIPDIELSSNELKSIFKNLIVLKKANLSDISPVIERINWKTNTFYFAYDEKVNFGIKGQDNKLIKPFYVKNKYDQVFKCLWNGVTVANSFNITSIANNSTHYTILHEGGTFDIDSLITIDTTIPEDYNGTFKVVGSKVGSANVICALNESFTMSADSPYLSGGRIRNAVLTSEEPILGTGTYTDDLIVKTSDGYKWKYLYTIDKAAKIKFSDDDYIAVPIKNIEKYPYSSSVGWGSIDVVNVVNGGSGYSNGTNTVNVLISGDGTGATAEAFVSNNSIQDITILNKGYDYTHANVSVIPATGYSGFGAEIDYSISPIGGHSFDLLQELYCTDVMVSVQFQRTESGKLPTDFSFNQIGIIYNPYLTSNTTVHSNSSYISCTTDMLVTTLGVPFIEDEVVYQGISLEDSTFRGTVLSFNSSNNYLTLINTTGTPQQSYELIGTESNTSKIIQQIFPSTYVPNSGNIFYVENKVDVKRDALGTEQIRILINYK